MKKILSIIIVLTMFLSMATVVCGNSELVNPFVDVAKDAWYHDEVVEAVYTGIINGKSATEFKPDDLLTYAEAVKLAACMNQVYLNGEVTLKAGNPWYQPYANYCIANNIIPKDYDYEANATRAGYVEIFANALPDSAFEDINNIPDGSILDVKDNAPYAIYVYKMYRAGILTGSDALHNFKPDDNIKRCEVAAIISRMMNENKRVEFDMPGASGKDHKPKENIEAEEPGKESQKTDTSDDSDKMDDAEKDAGIDNTKYDILPGTDNEPETVIPSKPVEGAEGAYEVLPNIEYEGKVGAAIQSELTIHKQPEGFEAEEYGGKYELEVLVFGGKAPYSYQWFYYTGHRNETAEIENGDYAKDAKTEALVLSIEKESSLLGRQIYCEITDSLGAKVKTDRIRVYGPFSMPVETCSIVTVMKEYIVAGRVADGILRKGEKVSVIRNGKVIAIGVANDLQMFNKSLDEICKNDNAGIVFEIEDGATPRDGDIVVKYQPYHVVDTSDIIN